MRRAHAGRLVGRTHRPADCCDLVWAVPDVLLAVAGHEKRRSRRGNRPRAAARQASIAKRTFETLERPYIYIFGASRVETANDFETAFVPFASYSVANYGKLPAVVESVIVTFGTSTTSAPDTGLYALLTHDLLNNRVIAPNERREGIKEELPMGINWHHSGTGEVIIDLADDEELFFRVQILYSGPFTAGHETSACWRLSELDNRFSHMWLDKFNYVQ